MCIISKRLPLLCYSYLLDNAHTALLKFTSRSQSREIPDDDISHLVFMDVDPGMHENVIHLHKDENHV